MHVHVHECLLDAPASNSHICTDQNEEMHTFEVWFSCFTCAEKIIVVQIINYDYFFNLVFPGDCMMCSAISNH